MNDYFRLIGPFLLGSLTMIFSPRIYIMWVQKHGAYIRDPTKTRQELVEDKLVTIIAIFEITML